MSEPIDQTDILFQIGLAEDSIEASTALGPAQWAQMASARALIAQALAQARMADTLAQIFGALNSLDLVVGRLADEIQDAMATLEIKADEIRDILDRMA